MKLKTLLVSAVALLCSAASWAYGWSDSDGASVGTGEFYFYNVGSQRFLTQGCWWGTHMAADGAGKVITISGSANAYNLHMAGINATKWLSGGDYVDTDVASGKTATTDDNLQWTFTLVDATSHTYTIKNNSTNKYLGSISDTQYNTGHSVESSETASSNRYYWILIPKTDRETLTGATPENPIDATHLVTNPDGEYYIRHQDNAWKEFSHGGWNGTFSHNSTPQTYYVSTFQEIWAGDAATSNGTKVGNNWHLNDFDEYNDIESLPKGKYRITMTAEATQQGSDPEDITGAYIYANKETTAVTTRKNYDVECFITDGTIKAGMKTESTTANWVSFDNLRLTYFGNGVQYYAPTPTDFSSSTALTSGMWYAFTVPSNGRYKITVTTAATLSYTQTGSDDADGDLSTIDIAASGNKSLTLSEGTFYFKSKANTNVTISACTYTVDAATSPSIVNGSFYNTKTLSSFTTSIGGSTDDADATIGIIGTPVATLSKGASPVATGTLSWSDGTLTATFSDVALTANAEDYNISIPAGAFGYAGHATNSAISIEFNTPVVFDGTYYLYDATNKLFLGRGANYGTRAVVDKYGVPFTWSNSTKLISFVDWTGSSLFFDKSNHSDCWVFTDGASGKGDDRLMAFTDAGDGKVYLQDDAKAVWIKHDNSVLNVPITSSSTATKWTVMTKAERDAIVNAYPTDNKNNVTTEAGITTNLSLDDYLTAHCEAGVDKTSLIGTATFSGSVGSWTYTAVRTLQADDKTRNPAYGTKFAEVFEITGTHSQTIGKANLPAGIYKVTVDGFERRTSSSTTTTLGDAGHKLVSTYMSVNGEQVRLADWYDVHAAAKAANSSVADNYPNSTTEAVACFTANYAKNEVYVYLDGNTDLEIKVCKPTFISGNWAIFNNFKLTYYADKVAANKKTIADNNGDITSLINGEFTDDADGWSGGVRVDNLARNWRNGNDNNPFYEVNASNGITDGKGKMSYTVHNMPAGTYKVVAAARAYSGGVIQPEIAGTTGTSLTGVGDTQAASSEINMNGVQMPYSSLGGFTTNDWGHNWQWISATGTMATDGDLVINFNCTGTSWMPIDDVHLYCTHLNAPSTDYTQTLSTISGNTSVTNTGNASVVTCDIVMSNPNAIISSSAVINGAAGSQINNNLVSGTIANMVLYDGYSYTSPAGAYAVTSATYYRNISEDAKATVMLPFDLDAMSRGKGAAYAPVSYANDNVSFSAVSEPVADVPYVFVPSSDITSLTGSRASASEGSKTVTGTKVTLYGTYAPTAIDKNANNYVASQGMLWLVDSDINSNPFRAYLHVGDLQVKSLSIRLDDATGIQAVEGPQSLKTSIYNLAGQRLNKLQKGINIVNGKKVLVK